MEKNKTGRTQELTDHLNTIDTSGSIQFTQEEDANRTISFLDMNVHTEKTAALKTHFAGNTRSLTSTSYGHENIPERTNSLKKREAKRRTTCTAVCQYPRWAINKRVSQKRKKGKKTREHNYHTIRLRENRSNMIDGKKKTEKHHIYTALKLHTKLRKLLVLSKGKVVPN